MRRNDLVCDRCDGVLGANVASGYGIGLTVEYHHPKKLDLCKDCEKSFALWLGKHPHSGVPLAQIAAGNATGQGYPSAEQAREAMQNHPILSVRDG
jgi:hypothetical protein